MRMAQLARRVIARIVMQSHIEAHSERRFFHILAWMCALSLRVLLRSDTIAHYDVCRRCGGFQVSRTFLMA